MTKIFSLKGKGLKFDTAADVETYLRDLAAKSDVEAIDISGNTWRIRRAVTVLSYSDSNDHDIDLFQCI